MSILFVCLIHTRYMLPSATFLIRFYLKKQECVKVEQLIELSVHQLSNFYESSSKSWIIQQKLNYSAKVESSRKHEIMLLWKIYKIDPFFCVFIHDQITTLFIYSTIYKVVQGHLARVKHFGKFCVLIFMLFQLFCTKEMTHFLTSDWSAQHPKVGQNTQHLSFN